MKLQQHPLWHAGFRPFFSLACLAGLSLPALWAAIVSGIVTAPNWPFSVVQWHTHEMLFGFGWAVLGGFLLTATKNWVGIRGYHGYALMLLAVAWCIERLGMWFAGSLPPLLFRVSNNLFLGSIIVMLTWTLVRHRKTDSFRDNYFFLVILPAFLLAKTLILSTDQFQIGWSMTLGLFRVAFLVMLERTVSQFMKGTLQAVILRNASLDNAIKLLALMLVAEPLLPTPLAGGLALLLAVLLSVRFAFWKPHLAFRRLDIGVMYMGYLAIVAQLLMIVLNHAFDVSWIGALSAHVFSFGAMGLIIPAMMIRISKGHTGRKVVFDDGDKLVLYFMLMAFCLRIFATQLFPTAYLYWIGLAAFCWFLCYATLAWRYIPFLWQPRVDGKI